jgi:nucleoside 2-deoxyribosyltransferase
VPSVYVASPYGFSPATRGFYDAVLLPAITAAGWTPHDPWADLDGSVEASFRDAAWMSPESRVQALRQINRRLGENNESLIRSADALFAVLDGVDVDSGTAAEIGFAAALATPVVGLRLDLRRTGDNDGATVNLQVEHWISDGVWTTVDEAVAALVNVGKRR